MASDVRVLIQKATIRFAEVWEQVFAR